jgi:hypothetical protein
MLTHLGGDDGIAGVISGTIDTVLAAEAPKIVALHLSPYRLLSLPTETQMLEHLMESDVLNGLISGPMDIVLAQEGSQIYSLDLSPSRLLTLPTMQQMTEHLMQPTALNGLISGPMDVVLFQEGPKIKELTLAPESLVSVPTEETFDTFLRTELDDFLSTDLNTLGIAPRLGVLDLRLSDFVRVDRGNLADLLQTELQLALDDVSASPVLHRLIEWDTTGFAENLADVIVDMDEDRLVGNEISAGGGIGGLTTSRGFITRR